MMFHRFLRPIQPFSSRRAYSLFSKPPGGRFFNSSKPPKVVPAASTAKSPTRVDGTNTNDPQQASSPSPDDSSSSASPVPSSSTTPHSTANLPTAAPPTTILASHPPLSAPDLRLHQFFAQHRPLVLSQPATALFDASSTLVLGPTTTTHSLQNQNGTVTTLDNPPETTPEADADTARLLARTLAMNAVSSSVGWDDTLRRLGLNPAEGRAAENAALEDLAVGLDSTQRKRRKKMKKHKCASFCYLIPPWC